MYWCLKANGNYADKVQRNTRCVTVNYAGEFTRRNSPGSGRSKLRRKAGSALAAVLTGFRARLHQVGLRQIAAGMRYVPLPERWPRSRKERAKVGKPARWKYPSSIHLCPRI